MTRDEGFFGNMMAVARPDKPGAVTISWTTAATCPTRFEYGPTGAYGRRVELGRTWESHTGVRVQQADGYLVHRVRLEGLDPDVTYHARALGSAADGTEVTGPDFVFHARPPTPPPGAEGRHSVPLRVVNPHPFRAQDWPVNSGIPFPRGVLGDPERLRLLADGVEVFLQVRPLSWWSDGSVQGVLLTFMGDVPANSERTYTLEYGRAVHRGAVADGLVCREREGAYWVDTGKIRFAVDGHGNLARVERDGRPVIGGATGCRTMLTVPDGATFASDGAVEEVAVEEAGPLRVTLRAVSHLRDADGNELLRLESRFTAYRGSPRIELDHTFLVVGAAPFSEAEQILYRIPAAESVGTWQVSLAMGGSLTMDAAAPLLRQPFDDKLARGPVENPQVEDGRVAGVFEGREFSLVLRDFWQNYPKGFAVRPDGVDLEICPPFAKGLYDGRLPFEEVHLFYYLLNGFYRFRQGVSKTHKLLFSLEGDAAARREACALFQRPLLATAPADWYAGAGVFTAFAPRDERKWGPYEAGADALVRDWPAGREKTRDYGMLNYGDWWPERTCNWGNQEYDTQFAFFLQYMRSGDAEAFFQGELAEWHNRDVDTVHWSPVKPGRLGAVYPHTMGHTGEYYDRRPEGATLGSPRGGHMASHVWVEGHLAYYLLAGDRRSRETAVEVADFFVRKYFSLGRPYSFPEVRGSGWQLMLLSAVYRVTADPYYLNAARLIVEHALLKQLRDASGAPCGWDVGKDSTGSNVFQSCILLMGLRRYLEEEDDPRVRQAVIDNGRWVAAATRDSGWGNLYVVFPGQAIAQAYRLSEDQALRQPLVELLAAGLCRPPCGYGKEVQLFYRCAPRLLAELDAAGINLNPRKDDHDA